MPWISEANQATFEELCHEWDSAAPQPDWEDEFLRSLTGANETSQLRLGLGQLLEYRHLLQSQQRVRAILFVEREPSATHWQPLCRQLGIELHWPETITI